MYKHEIKYCPRCGIPFECKVGSIGLCQCTAVTLTEDERDFIDGKFDDCLCANCMKELKAEYRLQGKRRPANPAPPST
ncbi:MAG TPA: cysteine-rich CWC family protein [Chitinophagaceae bacterium]|nr:cysteine-rich CWC family protein [Chitinophagaceae bacterium]